MRVGLQPVLNELRRTKQAASVSSLEEAPESRLYEFMVITTFTPVPGINNSRRPLHETLYSLHIPTRHRSNPIDRRVEERNFYSADATAITKPSSHAYN